MSTKCPLFLLTACLMALLVTSLLNTILLCMGRTEDPAGHLRKPWDLFRSSIPASVMTALSFPLGQLTQQASNIPKAKLYLVTPCFRPEYLHSIRATLPDGDRYDWAWVIIYEFKPTQRAFGQEETRIYELWPGLKESTTPPPQAKIAPDASTWGNLGRNLAITLIDRQDSYLYFLDDDTGMHPNFWKHVYPLVEQGKHDFIAFDQQRYPTVILKGNRPQVDHMDTGSFVVKRATIQDTRWHLLSPKADGLFGEATHQRAHDALYVDKICSLYNYFTQEGFDRAAIEADIEALSGSSSSLPSSSKKSRRARGQEQTPGEGKGLLKSTPSSSSSTAVGVSDSADVEGETDVDRLLACYHNKDCEKFNYETFGWLTEGQRCLLNCLGFIATSTVVEQGVFTGLSTLNIAGGLKKADRGVKLLSHDIFPSTICTEQPYCWECNENTCNLIISGEPLVDYPVTREAFEEGWRPYLETYGSLEKWVLSKLYKYNYLDQVFVISSAKVVPGEYRYFFLDNTHSCEEIEMNMPGIMKSAAADAIFLFHDIDNKAEREECVLKVTGRERIILSVDGLAVV